MRRILWVRRATGFAAALLLMVADCHSQDRLLPFKQHGRWGYCDASGTVGITPTFAEAGFFNPHFAVVTADGKKGLIDRRGAWVLGPEYSDISSNGEPSGEDTYVVSTLIPNDEGFEEKQGLFIPGKGWLIPQRKNVSIYFGGAGWEMSVFGKDNDPAETYALVNGKLRRIKTPHPAECNCFNAREFIAEKIRYADCGVRVKNGKVGYHYYIPRFAKRNRKWIAFRRDIPCVYDSLFTTPGSLYTGGRTGRREEENRMLLVAWKDGKKGLINYKNEIVTSIVFDELPAGKSGILRKNGLAGYFDSTWISIPCKYDSLFDAGHDLFVAKYAGKAGIVYRNDSLIVPFRFNRIRPVYQHPDHAIFWASDGRSGLYRMSDSATILPAEYDKITLEAYCPDGEKRYAHCYLLTKDRKNALYSSEKLKVITSWYDTLKVVAAECNATGVSYVLAKARKGDQTILLHIKNGVVESERIYGDVSEYSESVDPNDSLATGRAILVTTDAAADSGGYIDSEGRAYFPR